MHVVGDDTVAPSMQAMERDNDEWSVQPLTIALVDGVRRLHNEGFGSKICCLCCPVTDDEGRLNKFYEKHPERLPMCGLAMGTDGTPLGFVMLAIHPMHDKDGMHETKPGEAYIEQLAVAAAARGRGIGKLLLQWAEAKAREHGCNLLTLGVLHGNPARRLYERFGFVAKRTADPCEVAINGCVVFCVVGRPYGLCDPHCGVAEMAKPLAPDET